MIFVTYKESILTAIDRVSKIVKSNPRAVDILQCVQLETYGNEVYMVATSPMASARVLISDAKVGEPGKAIINLDRLKDRVSKAADSMRIETDQKMMKIVSSSDQKLGLVLNDAREYPEIEWSVTEESYGLVKSEFINLLQTSHSITSSTTALTPAFLQVQIADQVLWVANGVTYQKFPIHCNPELTSTIPTATLSSLASFIKESEGDTVWLSQQSEDSVVVTVGQDQYQAVPLAIGFPDLGTIFDRTKVLTPHELNVSRSELLAELSKAKTSVDSFGKVTLTLSEGAKTRISIQAKADNGDWFESAIVGIWSGGHSRELTFNLESLVKFIQSFKTDRIQMHIGDDSKGDVSPIYCVEGDRVGILNQFKV